MRLHVAGVFLGLFAISSVAAFHGGFERELEPGLSIASSAERLLETRDPTSDVSEYARNGIHLAEGRPLEEHHLNYWPPGMLLTVFALDTFVGLDAYPRKMIWLSVFAWSLALAAVCLLSGARKFWIAPLWAGALWALPGFREFTFGMGSILSESLSTAWFIGGVSLAWYGLRNDRMSALVGAALAFGAAANYRMYFLMTMRAVLIALLLIAAVRAFQKRDKRRLVRPALLVFAFFSTIVPWSIYKLYRQGTPKWDTASTSYLYGRMWDPHAESTPWAVAANAQCLAEPELCALIDQHRDRYDGRALRRLGVMTTLAHPFRVAAVKLEHASVFWWGKSWSELATAPTALIEGLLLLLFGGIGVASLVRRRSEPGVRVALIAIALFIAYNLALFTFLHFEQRFSLPIRAVCFLLPLVMFEKRPRLD